MRALMSRRGGPRPPVSAEEKKRRSRRACRRQESASFLCQVGPGESSLRFGNVGGACERPSPRHAGYPCRRPRDGPRRGDTLTRHRTIKSTDDTSYRKFTPAIAPDDKVAALKNGKSGLMI